MSAFLSWFSPFPIWILETQLMLLGTFTQQPIFPAYNDFNVGHPFSFPLLLPVLSLFLSQIFRSLTGVDKASGHTSLECGRSACLNVQNGPESMFVRLYEMTPQERNAQVTQALPGHLFSLLVLG